MRFSAALCLACAAAVGIPGRSAALAASDLQAVRLLAVEDGGRHKPLDTYARETARRVTAARAFGAESVLGLDPVEWVLAMLVNPRRWQDERMVRVAHAELRQALDLPPGRDRYSFRELADHEPFLRAAEQAHAGLRGERDAALSAQEREVTALYETLSVVSGILSGDGLRLVPPPEGSPGAWLSLAELAGRQEPWAADVKLLVAQLLVPYERAESARLRTAATALGERLRRQAPGVYPRPADLAREVHYNRLKPFRQAWVGYLAGSLLLLASLPLGLRPLAWAGLASICAGFAVQTWGLVLRTLISGRAPVTNMYESVVFVAWGAVLIALGFEARHRVRYLAACAGGLAVMALILADSVPIMSGSIDPLVPVLRDNTWLTLHVLTITLGYAAFLLATGIAHVNLALHFFVPGRAGLLKTLTLFLYRSLQVGTLFLAVGTLLGGVWASYSWGRFWGWDPKETWSLVALLGYLGLLHGRLVGWVRDLGLAVGSILCFLLVLMAWYGVNFVLGTGLHSYGFGAGGQHYVAAFVALETALVAAALWRRDRPHAPPTAAVAPARGTS